MLKIFISLMIICSVLIGSEYDEWLKTQNQTYSKYKKSLDDEFSDMLKKDWEAYETGFTPTPYKEPKPKEIPQLKKEIVLPKETIDKSPIVKIKKIEEVVIEKPVENIIPKIIPNDDKYKTISIDFYSQKFAFQIDKNFQFNLSKINNDQISQSWQVLGKLDLKIFIDDLKSAKDKLSLNDWAMYLLLDEVSRQLYKDENKANIFNWFILSKMGYDTKIGYSKDNIYLMSTVKQALYQMSFFTMSDKKYYILTPNGRQKSIGSVYTYESNYPNATAQMSFNFDERAINLTTNQETKDLKFKFNGQEYDIKGSYSKDLVNFYKTFPQSEYQLYFHSKKSSNISNSLLISLKPLLVGKTEVESVNLLLRFVQTAFAYKTDEEQFSYEKVFFPEETLYYPYSDCEDRSIMFSYLVKNLLGLDVVGLKFEDHLAAAVAFSSKIGGDNFPFEGKTYTVSDPTYINANAGMTMPQYKNKSFEIVK